jgi:ribosome-associated protein
MLAQKTPLVPEVWQNRRMKTLQIHSQPIELCNVLKLHGMVSSGGMAKAEIATGQVRVNGEIETRKRKKIVSGDVVEYRAESVRVVLEEQK